MTDTRNQPPLPRMARGAIPTPRHVLARSMPLLMESRALPPPTFLIAPAKLSMWGNDVHGDCVTAEEAFAKACHNQEIFIPETDAVAWATRHGVLEGAYLYKVLDWMVTDGFQEAGLVYDDGPRSSVDWTDRNLLTSAISEGPVKIGVAADQLETAWRQSGGHNGWFASGFTQDNNEDHCVSLCGYGPLQWLAQQLGGQLPAGTDGSKPGYALFTWSSIGIIDEPSMLAITHEAWLRTPTTVIRKHGHHQPAADAGEVQHITIPHVA